MKKWQIVAIGIVAMAAIGRLVAGSPSTSTTSPKTVETGGKQTTTPAPAEVTPETVAKSVFGKDLMKVAVVPDAESKTTNIRVEFHTNETGADMVEWNMARYLRDLLDKYHQDWTTANLVAYKDENTAVYAIKVYRTAVVKIDGLTGAKLHSIAEITSNLLK